jgi:hypothetical protein
MTWLNNCNNRDRRIISVIAALGIMMAVFVILSITLGLDGLFFFPIVMSGVIRVAARAWITPDKQDALEADFYRPSRPILSFFMKAGTIEGAPFRAWSAPLHVGEMMGYIG